MIMALIATPQVDVDNTVSVIYSRKNHQYDSRQSLAYPNKMSATFFEAQPRWIRTAVTVRWDREDPDLQSVLNGVEVLYRGWSTKNMPPFSPYIDATFLHTAATARRAGLPCFTNGISLPHESTGNWTLHFKTFELGIVAAKGRRVGDANPHGYVCNRSEANQFLIRALVQQLQKDAPTLTPLLVSTRGAHEGVRIAAEMCGLKFIQLQGGPDGAVILSELDSILQSPENKNHSLIIAATLGNDWGGVDDIVAIQDLLAVYQSRYNAPTHLHVDASRTFDYLTTLPRKCHGQLGLPRLALRPMLDSHYRSTGVVHASTIVAGGLNFSDPPYVVVLKPRCIGRTGRNVEYIQGRDSTVAGSRDALNGLLVALQEERFGEEGIQRIYDQCRKIRHILSALLISQGVRVDIPNASLDLIVYPLVPLSKAQQVKWGVVNLHPGTFLMTIQPSVTIAHIQQFLEDIFNVRTISSIFPTFDLDLNAYKVSERIENELYRTVQNWRSTSHLSGGYPGNQATFSALGPILGCMLTRTIPLNWAQVQTATLLGDLKRRFGVPREMFSSFLGGITTGSTMGNRVGLLTALKHCPHGHVYMSTATHYSVRKVLEDRFDSYNDNHPRFSEIEADELGRMVPEAFAQRVQLDKKSARRRNQCHQVILLVNFGTTFTGGSDDVVGLSRSLEEVGLEIDYIHADGALRFGYDYRSVCLGPPRSRSNSRVAVQGITVSNHKFPGLSVSGLVLCYAPSDRKLAAIETRSDPRITLELWLFHQFFLPADIAMLYSDCTANACRLRDQLKDAGIVTRFNHESIITLVERQPLWLIEEFNLSPEDDWVHFITMPHITSECVDLFATSIIAHRDLFELALSSTIGIMNEAFKQPQASLHLKRIACWDVALIEKCVELIPVDLIEHFWQRWLRSAMSFAAVDTAGDPMAIFLIVVKPNRVISLDDIILKPKMPLVLATDIANQVISKMSQRQ
jgi:glutamate/tyrosine decarboxylase-like PLP-dependent enzyme